VTLEIYWLVVPLIGMVVNFCFWVWLAYFPSTRQCTHADIERTLKDLDDGVRELNRRFDELLARQRSPFIDQR
jgi:hypothetical protein